MTSEDSYCSFYRRKREREAWCKSMASLFTVIPGEISIYQKIQPAQEVIQKVHQYYGLPKSPPA
jgi:hypothetical protein